VLPRLIARRKAKAHQCAMSEAEYLNHQLECPYCLKIRLRIPAKAKLSDPILCSDCGEFLGLWDDLQEDFERQGGQNGVFRLDKGRIKRLD
jgi:hypothetical protein